MAQKKTYSELGSISEWAMNLSKDQYTLLIDVISTNTFDLTVDEYRRLKKLPVAEKLENHMSQIELILAALSDVAASEINQGLTSKGFDDLLDSARRGSRVGPNARKEIEQLTGRPVVRSSNFLESPESEQRKIGG
ncbi:MAG: hypothetical protein AAGD96_15740 [Chloroflexota bacterium]